MQLKNVTKAGWYRSVKDENMLFCVCELEETEQIDEYKFWFDIWEYEETVDGVKHYDCNDGAMHYMTQEAAEFEVVPEKRKFVIYNNCSCKEVRLTYEERCQKIEKLCKKNSHGVFIDGDKIKPDVVASLALKILKILEG